MVLKKKRLNLENQNKIEMRKRELVVVSAGVIDLYDFSIYDSG